MSAAVPDRHGLGIDRPVRRRTLLLATVSGLVVAGLGARSAEAATDDELAYANFGLAAAYLAADYYAHALEADKLGADARRTLRSGRAASLCQARALSDLITGAGDTPAASEDFAFEWPAKAFDDRRGHPHDGARRPPAHARGVPERRRRRFRELVPRAVREPRREPRPAGRCARRLGSASESSRSPSPSTSRRASDGARGIPRLGEMRMRQARHRVLALGLALVVAALAATDAGARSTATPPLTIYAAASLTEVFKALDPAQNYSFAGLQRARDADQERCAGGHLRVRRAAQHAAALQRGARRQAGHVHRQPPRADRAEVEPGRDQVDLRPAEQAREARGRRAGRAGRRATRSRC